MISFRSLIIIKKYRILWGIAFLLFGLYCVFTPRDSVLEISFIIGLLAMISALARLVVYFYLYKRILYIYLLIALLGGYVMMYPQILVSFFPSMLGFALILSGIVRLSNYFERKNSKVIIIQENNYKYFELFNAIVFILLGLFIFFNPMALAKLMVIIFGIMNILIGMSLLIKKRIQ